MITGKLLGLLAAVIVICIAASGLVGWSVASATLASADSTTTAGAPGSRGDAGATGSNGTAGANGNDGSAGADGTDGAAGTKGATGAPGPQGSEGAAGAAGAQGLPGVKGDTGDQGTTGASGASAPSFAVTSASGIAVPIFPQQNFGNPIGVPVQIPAGPALVGFTVTITDPFFDFSTCSLVDATTNAVIASAAPITLSPSPTTVSTTQVVTLAGPTTLQLQCGLIINPIPDTYTGLSVYAISFATS
ncbi:MAG TPA: hypothetical protein VK537_09580 [Galbitalea sp.]|nr:hypothetical protein [Galbitalea sp.]